MLTHGGPPLYSSTSGSNDKSRSSNKDKHNFARAARGERHTLQCTCEQHSFLSLFLFLFSFFLLSSVSLSVCCCGCGVVDVFCMFMSNGDKDLKSGGVVSFGLALEVLVSVSMSVLWVHKRILRRA